MPAPRRQRLKESWNSFIKGGVYANVPPHVKETMRLCFYAGASSCFAEMVDLPETGDETADEDAGVVVMFELKSELEDFAGVCRARGLVN